MAGVPVGTLKKNDVVWLRPIVPFLVTVKSLSAENCSAATTVLRVW